MNIIQLRLVFVQLLVGTDWNARGLPIENVSGADLERPSVNGVSIYIHTPSLAHSSLISTIPT